MAKALTDEPWQKRSQSKPYTRYALGAMQAVDAEYTQKSIETATQEGLEAVVRRALQRIVSRQPVNEARGALLQGA